MLINLICVWGETSVYLYHWSQHWPLEKGVHFREASHQDYHLCEQLCGSAQGAEAGEEAGEEFLDTQETDNWIFASDIQYKTRVAISIMSSKINPAVMLETCHILWTYT